MEKVCIIVSSPFTLEVFLLGQIRALTERYEVTVIVNAQDPALLRSLNVCGRLISVPIERKIRLVRDIRALGLLFGIFRKNRFDLVHSITPKAGLLAMTAGFLARIPIRIHTFTGQVWGTQTGMKRFGLKMADKMTAFLASDVLVDSISQRDFIVQEKVLPREKATVLANGSISGVNVNRFQPNPGFRARIRTALRIPLDAFVVLYMSRLTRDKGAIVMAEAFGAYGADNRGAHLVVVGPDEEMLRPRMRHLCERCIDRVHFVDLVHVPEEYMAGADVFCLPSYREGFGTALINAAAVGIPAIASRIYGSIDAVAEGSTGLLFEPGDVAALVGLLSRLAGDPEMRTAMGARARDRVVKEFSEELLTASLLAFYRSKLDAST